jgi:BirA family biotin operon repressor/biotin-[acetyl-CoA-carboxylase] ligase
MDNVYTATLSWCQDRDFPHFSAKATASTSDWAKQDVANVSEPTLFLAETQTAGRGRGSNSWTSPDAGAGFLATYVFPLESPPQPIASPQFGLHLFKSLRSSWPSLDWSIKAPNDLYLGSHKVAGLLLETIQTGTSIHLLIGMGMNVFSHPQEEKNATHLNGDEGLGSSLDEKRWHGFLDQLLSNFSLAADASSTPHLSEAVREDLVEALNKNPRKPGLIIEVSSDGDLVFDDKTISWKDL